MEDLLSHIRTHKYPRSCPCPQAQAEDAVLDNLVGEELASAADILDLGDGLTMESGVAQRLFQFQLTGDCIFALGVV